jgi:hypothetical protein
MEISSLPFAVGPAGSATGHQAAKGVGVGEGLAVGVGEGAAVRNGVSTDKVSLGVAAPSAKAFEQDARKRKQTENNVMRIFNTLSPASFSPSRWTMSDCQKRQGVRFHCDGISNADTLA